MNPAQWLRDWLLERRIYFVKTVAINCYANEWNSCGNFAMKFYYELVQEQQLARMKGRG